MKSIKITELLLLTMLSTFSCLAQDNQIPFGNNPKAGHYANVNGIKMYYEIYGEGQPLLLIHGNGGSIKSSSSQIPFFSKHYSVIVVDSRGQGKTGDNSDSLTYSLMTEDFYTLLNYLKLDSVLVFGQSDGAIIGLLLAARHPEKVKMLAAMSPNIRPDDSVFYPESVALDHKFFDILQKKSIAGEPGGEREFKLQRLMAYHPHINTGELQNIKSPVLLMTGDRDLIRLSHIIEIFGAIPNSNLCVLPGSTHFALRQNPVVFNETLYRFFSEPFIMPTSIDYLEKILDRYK
jgi:pimeloyl-ACP methyl ester carboxylesterase